MENTKLIPDEIDKTVLNVGTVYGSQIYITTGQGEAGFDFEMASRFAEYLNLDLAMKPYSNIKDLYQALDKGEIDLIAAGLTDTATRRENFRLGPPLYRVNQVLVYKQGTHPPKHISQLKESITVITDSSFVETLAQLQHTYTELTWEQEKDKDSEELLAMIARGEIPYTIADSTTFEINRRYMPELRAGLVLKEKQAIVWLLPAKNSDRLMSSLLSFWHDEKRNGSLAQLNENTLPM